MDFTNARVHFSTPDGSQTSSGRRGSDANNSAPRASPAAAPPAPAAGGDHYDDEPYRAPAYHERRSYDFRAARDADAYDIAKKDELFLARSLLPGKVATRLIGRDQALRGNRDDLRKLLLEAKGTHEDSVEYWQGVVWHLEAQLLCTEDDLDAARETGADRLAEVRRLEQELRGQRGANDGALRESADLQEAADRAVVDRNAAREQNKTLKVELAELSRAHHALEARHDDALRRCDRMAEALETKIRDGAAQTQLLVGARQRSEGLAEQVRTQHVDRHMSSQVMSLNEALRGDVRAATTANQRLADCLRRCEWLAPCVSSVEEMQFGVDDDAVDAGTKLGLFSFDASKWAATKRRIVQDLDAAAAAVHAAVNRADVADANVDAAVAVTVARERSRAIAVADTKAEAAALCQHPHCARHRSPSPEGRPAPQQRPVPLWQPRNPAPAAHVGGRAAAAPPLLNRRDRLSYVDKWGDAEAHHSALRDVAVKQSLGELAARTAAAAQAAAYTHHRKPEMAKPIRSASAGAAQWTARTARAQNQPTKRRPRVVETTVTVNGGNSQRVTGHRHTDPVNVLVLLPRSTK
jgi:hypothetical protein